MRWSVHVPARLVRIGGALVAACVLGGCGALPSAAPAPPTLAPAAGTDGVVRVRFDHRADVPAAVPVVVVPRGSTVELVVGSDVAERVVLGGYDRTRYVTAGGTVTLRFVVDRPGRLPVTLGSGAPLGRLDVP